MEKETATCSTILAWKISWTAEPGVLWGCKESDTTEQLNRHHMGTSNLILLDDLTHTHPLEELKYISREGAPLKYLRKNFNSYLNNNKLMS